MSPVVRLDEEVFNGLKKIAVPLEDTPNTVIRRLLADAGILPKEKDPTKAADTGISGERTSQETLRLPLLQVLNEMGGGGRPIEVLERLGKKIKGKLTPQDLTKTQSGHIRWRVYARWTRQRMKNEGLLGGPNGRWTITEKGRNLLKTETTR